MIPTPGQKVWIANEGGRYPASVYAAIAVAPATGPRWVGHPGWWWVDIEGIGNGLFGHQQQMSPRDDPPPQQEPKREQTGHWDSCVWKPAREVA